MTVIVSDTSPLSYLVQIGCDHCLPALYDLVLIPDAVLRELEHPRTPEVVLAWLTMSPRWLVVRHVPVASGAGMDELHPGEREAIQLAIQENADLLLMDERAGVAAARERGLVVTGTLGVLLQASLRGLVEIDSALRELQNTNFRCTPEVIADVKRRARTQGS